VQLVPDAAPAEEVKEIGGGVIYQNNLRCSYDHWAGLEMVHLRSGRVRSLNCRKNEPRTRSEEA
jgi:hypothetical protein